MQLKCEPNKNIHLVYTRAKPSISPINETVIYFYRTLIYLYFLHPKKIELQVSFVLSFSVIFSLANSNITFLPIFIIFRWTKFSVILSL